MINAISPPPLLPSSPSLTQGRRLVSDFGMLTAILLMVLLAYLVRDLIAVEILVVPPNYATSNITRGWFINPFNGTLSVGECFGAIIPAVLVSGCVVCVMRRGGNVGLSY